MTSSHQKHHISQESKVSAPNYLPIPVVLIKGKGIWLYDTDGKKYIDMMSAFSAVSHGHCNQEIIEAMYKQANKLCVPSRAFHTDNLLPFLQKLCMITDLDMAILMNSGSEGVETAIKAARRWGYKFKNIPDNKAEIIVAKNNFHGRTTTVVSFSSEDEYKKGFGPFTPGFVEVEFGNTQSLENAITDNTCAFIVEPMQGEAGIILPPKGWLKQVREICDKHNILLIVDEIQTGLGRTGKMFAFQHENVQVDGIILGKALGGGVMPISAFVGKQEMVATLTPGSHGSTFGGSALAAAVGLKALEIIERDNYAQKSAELGQYLLDALHKINSPLIKDIRGAGLWIALEIDTRKISARIVCEQLMKNGLLSKETHGTVIRLAPPLVITKEETDIAIEIIAKSLQECE